MYSFARLSLQPYYKNFINRISQIRAKSGNTGVHFDVRFEAAVKILAPNGKCIFKSPVRSCRGEIELNCMTHPQTRLYSHLAPSVHNDWMETRLPISLPARLQSQSDGPKSVFSEWTRKIYTILQNKRSSGAGWSPLIIFGRLKLPQTNYISSKTVTYRGVWIILNIRKLFNFVILWAIFAKYSKVKPFLEVRKISNS